MIFPMRRFDKRPPSLYFLQTIFRIACNKRRRPRRARVIIVALYTAQRRVIALDRLLLCAERLGRRI